MARSLTVSNSFSSALKQQIGRFGEDHAPSGVEDIR